MAANPVDYVDALLRRQMAAVDQLGVKVLLVDKQLYDINLSLLVLLGVVMKALNDKGVVLDAEWLARVNGAAIGAWPDWILDQTDPPS